MKSIAYSILLITLLGAASCVDTISPTGYLLPEQIENMNPEQAQERMLSGIVAFVNNFSTWSSSETYYTQDWGYPCQMFYREVLGCDIPVFGGSYNYWINEEKNASLTGASYYTYYYYYKFINNCNNLIRIIDPAVASETSLHNLGCALTFRALCYLDMARLFEFMPTGYADYDNEAAATGIWGLTVPLVSDKTPAEQLDKNPRAPFTTMYRFILNDLNKAERFLAGYNRPVGSYPDQSVVYGMQARLWLEMGTRFDTENKNERGVQDAERDLKAQLAMEGCNDGYADLGVTTATECYAKAADYARKAQAAYTPMTQYEWQHPTTGFNTATNSWMLFSRVSTQEQEAYYYSTMLGVICTEATWGMPQYGGGNYRCIGEYLYNYLPDTDWRKTSWLAPDDATLAASSIKIKNKQKRDEVFNALRSKYNSSSSDTIFSRFPAYANFKFRTRDASDMIEGLKCDLPLMRVEEMYFIEAEAEAHLNGAASGAALLQKFVSAHRDASYVCKASDLKGFTDEMMLQKRVEFWGEGICFFDYKRLRLPVQRSRNSNYPSDMRHDSKDGYVCPAMNYYILNYEINNNPAVVGNPDCTKWNEKK